MKMNDQLLESTASAPATVVELLQQRARHQPHQLAYTFLEQGDSKPVPITYGELDRQVRAIAASLQTQNLIGERALLLYPPGLEYIAAFFGCLYAGVVAVPAYPPHPARLERTFPRLRAITNDARPSIALTTSAILPMAEALFAQNLGTLAPRWLATDAVPPGLAQVWQPQAPSADPLAFLQYTSGSTAAPKGVVLTHGNLLHNLALIQQSFRVSVASRGVIWLPPYHDMGLIGGILEPLYGGFPVTLMSPVAFLQSPLKWLEAISNARATISGGPNFAYELCVRKTTPEQRAALDLSSWEVAFNGAEPIQSGTLERFATTFAPNGFRPDAFYPCYGLAEATLIVSGSQKPSGLVVRAFQGASLERHQVWEASSSHENARRLVGCGQSPASQHIRIVHPLTLTECAPHEVGEIWVSGPSIAQGYWNRPEETTSTFQARLAHSGEGPFLRTGDLGFFCDGELFITGRIKDLIIVRGRNHYPQDIEQTVEACHPMLRPGSGAAFTVEVDGEERLVTVQEVDRHFRDTDVEDVARLIRRAVADQHELQVYAVVLIRTGSIPKTSSGKIQRHACRAEFLANDLTIVGSSMLEEPSRPAATAGLTPELIFAARSETRQALLEAYLQEQASRVLGVPVSALDPRQPLNTLGIDSLMAVELQHAIESGLGVLCPMTLFLQGLSAVQLAAELRPQLEAGQPAVAATPVASATRDPESPLSYGQRALWFLHQLAPQSAAYHIASAARLPAATDFAALRRAFQALVDRHPLLRSQFPEKAGVPFRRVQEQAEVDFELVEASGWSEARLQSRIEEEAHHPFDLVRGPLLRVKLFTLLGQDPVLLLVVHHIAVDYGSMATLVDELGQLYTAEVNCTTPVLAPLPLQYADYVRWQTERLAGPEGERLWSYWQQALAGERPVLELPTDRPRPPVQTFNGAAQLFSISESLARRLRALAQAEGATLYGVLMAAFQVLLHVYTGQEEFWVGTPAAGRSRPQFADLIGYFVNPLVIRGTLSGDPTFKEFLRQVRGTVLNALQNQDYPFPLLVERLQPERDSSRSPLVQVMFVLEKTRQFARQGTSLFVPGAASRPLKVGALELEPMALATRAAPFDLMLVIEEAGDSLTAALNYNSDLFESATVERLRDVFLTLLESIVAQPEAHLSQLTVLPPAQSRTLLQAWIDTQSAYRRDQCLSQLFEAQVTRTPNAIALIVEGQRLTYHELNRRANQLAHSLESLGVGPELLVGVCLKRTADLVVALLAVLKAGGAYVPLDPAYPPDRLAWMLADAQATVVLTQESLKRQVPAGEARLLCVDADWQKVAGEDDGNPRQRAEAASLAYVLYTSGSTGRPKGVAITHQSAVALIDWAQTIFAPADLARVLASTSICFDLSIFELFLPLSCGGSVVMVENLPAFSRLPAAEAVTLINTVPSAMNDLIQSGALPASVHVVNLAGEVLPSALVRQIYQYSHVQKVFNLYGPSEDTTYSTFALIEREPAEPPPIGRPIANTQAYVLDAHLQPVPIGVPGELYLGGAGVARGYLHKPGLTAERFLPHPFSAVPGARLYRTGDRVRYQPDGTLEYLGRIDSQIKIRGFRIEPGEIEAALRQHGSIDEAAVIACETGHAAGDRRLVAYLVPKRDDGHLAFSEPERPWPQPALTVTQLRAFLRHELPDYMVPSTFVWLAAMPLTPNGKINRRALQHPPPGEGVPALARPELAQVFVAARTPVEEKLSAIWCEVLGLTRVGIYDNFFELGGHSLLATRVLSRIQDVFGVEPPLYTLFTDPTVANLALVIEQSSENSLMPPLPPIRARRRQKGNAEQILNQVAQLSDMEARQLLEQKRKKDGS